ncbi:MAG: hypothetical protein M1457_00250 [bacterium]|nr:hypothetical protein [bacterium]
MLAELKRDTRRELVEKAIAFQSPERIPVWFFNRDHLEGDILLYGVGLAEGNINEWGYEWIRLGDGTMGQPDRAVIESWDDFDRFRVPPLRPEVRMARVDEFMQRAGDRYRLASPGITGFTTYTFLRGYENSMLDFMIERERAEALLDKIFDFENEQARLAAARGFDGFHLADDWGTQSGLMIDPELWREIFKPRYARQAALVHELGMHLWFHCCGNIGEIVGDMHEIGVDVINISQPNVVDIEAVGARWRGRQCFMVPISYQTVSISGTPAEIHAEAQRLARLLACEKGGYIGYIEEYSCMGMSEENYRACCSAFALARPPRQA